MTLRILSRARMLLARSLGIVSPSMGRMSTWREAMRGRWEPREPWYFDHEAFEKALHGPRWGDDA